MVYFISLFWHRGRYNTHWAQKFKSKKKALELYLSTLRDQAKLHSLEEEEDDDIEDYIEEWNADNNENFKLMTNEEIDKCDCRITLEDYIEMSLNCINDIYDTDEEFELIFFD